MKPTPPALRHTTVCLLLALSAWPALAFYKVVAPDGSITYTDRPPAASMGRVTSLNRDASPTGTDNSLPVELRQVVAKYPVTLYTTADCVPCDNGRRLLQQRGVPYSERRVSTDEDAEALERLVGGRSVPALSIGPQPLRGFSETDWSSYLDAAGYPRTSRLPKGWPVPEATALTERAAPAPAPAAPPPRRAAPEPVPAPEPGNTPGTLRF
ncbi:MAG: glutaredoxin family protein [Rubrivivax sp.]|nr:glutaredoxin family protein [Rubrivivax sp.]